MPTRQHVRALAVELSAAAVTELVLLKVARRLKDGPDRPPHRWVRRAAGAMLSELLAEGMADLYWQRRRLRAEVDRRLAAATVEASHARRAHIPQQRAAGERLAGQAAPDAVGR